MIFDPIDLLFHLSEIFWHLHFYKTLDPIGCNILSCAESDYQKWMPPLHENKNLSNTTILS